MLYIYHNVILGKISVDNLEALTTLVVGGVVPIVRFGLTSILRNILWLLLGRDAWSLGYGLASSATAGILLLGGLRTGLRNVDGVSQ